jgi:hypothetical protein
MPSRWKAEEKGSDVNLATALLADSAAHRFHEAWVMSNDADSTWPVERSQAEYGVWIGVVKPGRPASYPTPECRKDSWHLRRVAAEFRRLKKPQLAACQLPDTLLDTDVPITSRVAGTDPEGASVGTAVGTMPKGKAPEDGSRASFVLKVLAGEEGFEPSIP